MSDFTTFVFPLLLQKNGQLFITPRLPVTAVNTNNTGCPVLLGQQMGRLHALGLHRLPRVCCKRLVSLVGTVLAATTCSLLCQGHQDTHRGTPGQCAYRFCVTMQAKTSGQEQPTGAGISDIPIALGGNQSTSSTLGTKMLQALFVSVRSLPSVGRAAAAKEKGLHISCCSLTHFFPLRPYPSYSGSKMAVKKCWQSGDLLL